MATRDRPAMLLDRIDGLMDDLRPSERLVSDVERICGSGSVTLR